MKKNNFFCILKINEERIRIRSQRYGSGDPDPHQNVTDPQYWPSLPLLAKTAATWGPFTATKFLLSLPHSQPYFWLNFFSCHFYSFIPQILLLLAFLLLRLCRFLLVSLACWGVISWCLTTWLTATSFPRTSNCHISGKWTCRRPYVVTLNSYPFRYYWLNQLVVRKMCQKNAALFYVD
jgi:hypothetical protein